MGQEAVSNAAAFSGTVLLSAAGAANDAGGPVADPLLGVELGAAYRIERVIGEGAMGRLYEASHLRLDRRFAIKILHQPLALRDDMRARFDREARVMSRVRSDHVVDVVDVAALPDGRACIVTELLEGCDLERHLEVMGGKLPVGEAVHLIREGLRGLASAHALGVVHRDLKPSNLFLARDASGRVTLKVLDFGVAKNGGDAELTAAGTIMGTPAYMAPEQARGARFADVRSDLYAMGAVLYRLLTGHPPYEEADVNGTLIRLLSEAPRRPTALDRSIPAGLEAMIEKAMARDPSARFQDAEELSLALAPFDSGESAHVSATGASANKAAATLTRKAQLVRPLAVSLAGLSALAASAGTVAILALLVAGFSKAHALGTTELILVYVGGAASLLGAGFAATRALQRAWRNAAAVAELSRVLGVTMLGFAGTLGALELGAIVWTTLREHRPAGVDPLYACARAISALAVALALTFRASRTKV
ncbi:MAG TPA: serine/threonine-protein kinase [Polyangiales bacterium]|nr:serine/threonine-protein kinase [Polyangiales bacterium]